MHLEQANIRLASTKQLMAWYYRSCQYRDSLPKLIQPVKKSQQRPGDLQKPLSSFHRPSILQVVSLSQSHQTLFLISTALQKCPEKPDSPPVRARWAVELWFVKSGSSKFNLWGKELRSHPAEPVDKACRWSSVAIPRLIPHSAFNLVISLGRSSCRYRSTKPTKRILEWSTS